VAEGGLRAAHDEDDSWLMGSHWQALAAAMDDAAPFLATLHAVAGLPTDARTRLRQQLRVRALLQYHCGSPLLRTRQLMMDLQSL